MNIAGWVQVATFTKFTTKGKLKDTFRIYLNPLGWCKGRSDKTGKDFYFDSLSLLHKKIEGLKQVRYKLASGEVPSKVISRYAAYTEDI